MSERGKTNKQNQVDQLNRDLLNMLDGTARPAGRMRMNGSTGRDTDIFDDISRDFKESSGASRNTAIPDPELIPTSEPIRERNWNQYLNRNQSRIRYLYLCQHRSLHRNQYRSQNRKQLPRCLLNRRNRKKQNVLCVRVRIRRRTVLI